MKKNSNTPIVFAVIFLILIIAGLAYFILNNDRQNEVVKNSQDSNVVSEPVEKETYEINSVVIKEDEQTYTLDIRYPQVQGLKNVENEDFINSTIKSYVENEVVLIKNTENPESSLFKPLLSFDYSIENKGDKILSLMMRGNSYTGGAHGNPILKTFNFNLENGNNITFGNILNNPSQSLNQFSEIVISKLKTTIGDEFSEQINSGASAEIDNFNIFNLNLDVLKVSFDAYQVGPYAIGNPEVEINYSEINNLLNENIKEILNIQ